MHKIPKGLGKKKKKKKKKKWKRMKNLESG